MEIKWTGGPGPAPMPYSKRIRDAMGYSDDDKPWAHPDPPVARSLGFGGSRQGDMLRTYLVIILVSAIAVIWAYRRWYKGHRMPFVRSAPARVTPSESSPVSQEQIRRAREARLKRFREEQGSFADAMREGAGGLPQGHSSVAAPPSYGVGEAGESTGLRHRGGNE